MKQLIFISLIILLISLVACGKPEEELPPNQEVVIDYQETVTAHQYLLKQHEELKVECDRLRDRDEQYLDAIRTLENANLALNIELTILKEMDNPEEYARLLNELAALKAERKDWDNLSKIRYQSILDQYNELDALYPLKNFPDKETLVDWRLDAGNITEERPLWVLQQLAREEGYLVVVGYNIPYGMAIVGDYWYKIIPRDKKLLEKLGKVE